MPQLHFYVPDDVAETLRAKAKAENKSLSKYLAETVQRDVRQGWPEGYFTEVAGSWIGDFERPEQLPLEERDAFPE
jgi:hypothetical protein